MLYRKYGKTNEQVSVLGFGCMRLPVINGDNTKIDEEKAMKMVRHAIDNGLNYIDTAYPYHGAGMAKAGMSEPFVAKVLKDGYRDRVKVATKLPSWLIQTREDMDKYLNEQLDRLEINTIDFYLVHALNNVVWIKLKELGVREFLDKAIEDGRIKHAGFSFHDKGKFFNGIVDDYDWSFCQIQYNYLDEEYQAGRAGLEYAASKGLGLSIMEPLRGGKIVNGLPEAARAAFEKAEIKMTPAEWAFRWVWNHPEVSLALSGMSTMEQVEENLRVAREAHANSLNDQELDIINGVKRIFKEGIKVNCTACEYCMPCPSGVDIPRNFSSYNDFHVFGSPDTIETYRANYNARLGSEERASQCIECGVCEGHCPQKISIREELKNVSKLFE